MKQESDIQQMIAGLRLKRRFRKMNHDKLARLFERTELDVSDSWLSSAVDLQLLRDNAAQDTPKRNTAGYIPKPVQWAAVTAVAAALIFFVIYPFAFKHDDRTGTARSVSGDVRVLRDGHERSLGAGDTVARGDILIAGRDSSADIRFRNSLQMRILGGSRISLRSVDMTERGRKFDALVSSGGCVIQVGTLVAGESVSVRTQTSVAVVRGTVFGVMIGETGAVRYEVFEGRVRVRRCMPDGVPVTPAAAAILERYFEDHAVEISGRQACGIGPDAKPLDGVSDKNIQNAIAAISMPGLLPGGAGLQLKNEAERLMETADVRDVKKVPVEGQNDNDLKQQVPGSGKPLSGVVNLIYVPELDFILTVGDRTITAFKFEEARWTLALDESISSLPLLEGTSLYVPSVNGTVTRIDIRTGVKQWAAHLKGEIAKYTRLALDRNGIYCATAQGRLYKLNRDGDVLWQNAIGGAVSATPVMTERLVFVPTSAGGLFGVDITNGVTISKVKIGSSIRTIGAHKENVFILTDAGRMYCYNYKNDEMLWNLSINDAVAGEMVLDNNSVYLFGRKGRIYCISTAGALKWERDIGSPILKMPSYDDTCFYVPASETLYVVDKANGTITWSLLVPRIMSGNVAVSRGHIYFGIEKNGLASLKK
jgi:hypothetical protein